ncbi:MAG: hypothetical protein HYX25_00025 [Candidatus Solibacter usitatus]|nr:hypothetical protein [Candidatus Solibacter usitatus]
MTHKREPSDPSHDLDLVTLFSSSRHDAEAEALTVHGVLESNGIPSFIVGPAQIPSLEFVVKVPQSHLENAERALAEAKAGGAKAAAEGEAASEEAG